MSCENDKLKDMKKKESRSPIECEISVDQNKKNSKRNVTILNLKKGSQGSLEHEGTQSPADLLANKPFGRLDLKAMNNNTGAKIIDLSK